MNVNDASLPYFNLADFTDDQVIRKALQILRERMKPAGALLSRPQLVRDYLTLHFAGHEAESFVVLFLSVKNRLIKLETMFTGSITTTSVHPREVVKRALAHNAASIILAHNHPSGDTAPSTADHMLTNTLKQALALVEIRVVDHIVVAGVDAYSFAENGQI